MSIDLKISGLVFTLSAMIDTMEQYHIRNTLSQTKEDYKFLICNDGSTDRTSEILHEYSRKFPIEVIEHPINRGLGESSRDLFERAVQIGKSGDIIIRKGK